VSRRGLLLTLACLFVVLGSARRADACSCAGTGAPCAAFGSASAVFVGTVTDARERKFEAKNKDDIDWTPVVFKFSVSQAFSGVEGAEAEVATGRGGGDCGYGFRKGETYLVYAFTGRDGKTLATGICMRTRPVSEASEDLEFLRGLAARPSGVSLSIQVARRLEGVKSGDSKPLGGLADARLVVEGEGDSREVKTDAGGRATLSGLKPGAYKVRLLLPEELTTYKEEQEVRVADRGCASVYYGVSDNGRIEGKVTDAEGRPVSGVTVTLVEADDPEPEKHYARYERTNDEGRYAFKGVPPGRYLLAVNLSQYPQPDDPTNAYPRTYYPGVARPADAEAVRLGAGEGVKGRDFTLQPRRAESVVEGVVVWDDGSPVAKAFVSFRDVTYHDPGIDNGAPQADEHGRFTLKGYQGQVLLISVRGDRPYVGDFTRDGPMERSEPVRVTLNAPVEPLRIVITKLR
jgi:5-hydroxyisourate hydrolase-like protein (transthyretin family)